MRHRHRHGRLPGEDNDAAAAAESEHCRLLVAQAQHMQTRHVEEGHDDDGHVVHDQRLPEHEPLVVREEAVERVHVVLVQVIPDEDDAGDPGQSPDHPSQGDPDESVFCGSVVLVLHGVDKGDVAVMRDEAQVQHGHGAAAKVKHHPRGAEVDSERPHPVDGVDGHRTHDGKSDDGVSDRQRKHVEARDGAQPLVDPRADHDDDVSSAGDEDESDERDQQDESLRPLRLRLRLRRVRRRHHRAVDGNVHK